jgi:very-short-patch-repair endonuclease
MTLKPQNEALSIAIEADAKVHYALQQNDVPLVKLLRLDNGGAEPIRDLDIELSLGDGLSLPWRRRVDALPAAATHNFENVDLRLDAAALRGRTERQKVALTVRVDQAGRELARADLEVEVLAFQEWPGLASLPELLASFVMPNHPAIDGLLARTATRLRQQTGDGSLDGYQARDRARVRAIAAAAFAALADCAIVYANPPASFEQQGQRVRLPDQVLAARLGTCLDLSLLYAAVLEQAGIRPLLCLVDGHACAGLWLIEDAFQEVAGDDGLRLRKRLDVGDVLLVETTMLAVDGGRDFGRAVEAGGRHLADLARFRAVIDVAAARRARFLPLPVPGTELPEAPEPLASAPAAPRTDAAVPQAPVSPFVLAAPAETPTTRLERWKRRLLDLGLRNRLIAFRETRHTIPLLVDELGRIEDALASGGAFRLVPRPAAPRGPDARDPGLHRERTGEDLGAALIAEERSAGRLVSGLAADELERRVLETWRHARTALEESGANTLYLALGTLLWYESPSSAEPRRAPILLLPIEIERVSALAGFRVRLGDDEPRVNATLLEKLQAEFGIEARGLDELLEDERGLDVAGILQRFRRAILHLDRWDVVDEAWIAPFSFTKFLMWLDLQERAERLLESPVLRHLVERPGEVFEPGEAFPEPDVLDETLPAVEVLCPLDADSSQLAAVRAAELGRSFVLEGPPGTGKSQTITNLIAQCIARGQRVLFVSEKMAALDVVRRRLESVGLGPFCLELHSSRASKREVLDQLRVTLEGARVREPAAWREEAARLEGARAALNAHIRSIHEVRGFGESVFRATSKLCGMRDLARVDLELTAPSAIDAAWVEARREAVDRLATAAAVVGLPTVHPLRAIRREAWEATLSDRFERQAADAARALDRLADAGSAAAALLGLDPGGLGRADFTDLVAAVRLVLDSPGPARAALTEPGWDALRLRLGEAVEAVRQKDALRAHVRIAFRDPVLDLDLDGLLAALRAAVATFWPLSWWRARGPRRQLAAVAATAGQLGRDAELIPQLASALELRARIRALAEPGHEALACFGRGLWRAGEADAEGLTAAIAWIGRLRALLGRLRESAAARAAVEPLVALATEERDRLAAGQPAGDALRALAAADAGFAAARDGLDDLLDLDEEAAFGAAEDPAPWLPACAATLATWRAAQRDRLDDWCHWRRTRSLAIGLDLAALVAAFEAGEIEAPALPAVFERAFREAWLAAVTDADEGLRTFHGREHERRIRRFAELDAELIERTRAVVAARLWAEVPQVSERAADTSEVGIVLREARKKSRHRPVRKLFRDIPHLLPRLKPCFLMSPLSVAQYLTPELPPFDLVVFDEASQITPWDAVGAIARGRSCVVVGDTRQLPPTSFFRAADADDAQADDLDFEELESILDECAAAGIRPMQLRWHYRSRHESLIAFSNHHYYDNRLLTFPGPEAETARLGVSLVEVPGGVYDRSKSRTNRAEADSVVADVLRRLAAAGAPEHAWSIGIVTFSQAQQQLIEDLLDEARRQDPRLEPFFHGAEPVFVKNLENVQGDERDVILFSVGYGPDQAGKVSMNFGPLNVAGGERRLNVAITRARRQVVVHATLRPDQIDLSRTAAVGVKHLKTFLDYAARGARAIAEATVLEGDAAFDSPFEQEVCARLRARGHDVALQVGCSGYRIDLAIRDPLRPGRFLLGIECDGAFYHSAKTARDRDRLREVVLRRLGWELCRVWSTDWWRSPEREIERIERALEAAARARPVEVEVEVPAAAEVAAPPPSGPEPAAEGAVEPSPAADEPPPPQERFAARPAAGSSEVDPGPEPAAPPPSDDAVYAACSPAPAGAADDLHLPSATPTLAALAAQVLEREAPIHRDLLCRRIAGAFEARSTQRVRERILGVVAALPAGTRPVEREGFLWPAGLDPDTWRGFRVPSAEDPASARSADEIPPEEIANAVAAVLGEQVALPRADLIRETGRRLGFARTGSRVEEAVQAGLALALSRGEAHEDGERIAAARARG